jgi:hypothetical protein
MTADPVRAAVTEAVEALQAFGELTRDQAATVLPYWRHYSTLGERGAAAVLRRFPPADPVDAAVEAGEPHPGGGWISGATIGGGSQVSRGRAQSPPGLGQ